MRATTDTPQVGVAGVREMTVEEIAYVHEGVIGPWQQMDMERLREEIRAWANWARANPIVKRLGCNLESVEVVSSHD